MSSRPTISTMSPLQGGRMGQNEEVLHPPPPAQGRVAEHQRKPSPTIYALHGRTFLCGNRPQTEWAK